MRPIFCGNFEFDTRQSDLERLFSKYGRVDRVDMKSGFAFISMDDEQDAGDAIRGLDQKEFGRQGRRLRVDWTKQERGGRRPGGSRSSGNSKPTKTLFVINFDPVHTRTRDLEKHFDPYGKILSIRIRRNFAFVQYDSQEDATKALDATNMSKLMDQVVSVEYAVRDDDGRRNRYSPDQRGREGSSDRSRYRGRSPSPHRRERDSPDYGHGPTSERSRGRVRPASPYRRDRDSPDYGRGPSPNAKFEPRGNRYQGGRNSGDAGGSPSPNGRPESRVRPNRRDRGSPSPSPNTRPESRVRPGHRDRNSPSPSPNTQPESRVHLNRRDRDSPNYDHSASPKAKLVEPGEVGRSPNPNDEPRLSTRGREKDGPKFSGDVSPNVKYEPRKTSQDHGRDIPDLDGGLSPPDTKPEPRGRHRSSRKSPVHGKKYHSRSPSPHKLERQIEKQQKRELTNI